MAALLDGFGWSRQVPRPSLSVGKWNLLQCRMARVGLGLGVRELADFAKVSTNTLARFERGEPLKERTVDAIRRALESAGVEFTDSDEPGVKLRRKGA